MHEDAQEIFEYLPIQRNQLESQYIDHLWNAFLSLDESDPAARPFVIMPFHLLFMLAVQYKILRISKEKHLDYKLVFTIDGGRDREKISKPVSVFDLGLLNERTVPDLFKLIDLDIKTIKQIKELIDNRNDNLAHAKGGIELDPDTKITEYLQALENIQEKMTPLNNVVANDWREEITGEDNLNDFTELKMLDAILCPADFKNSKYLKDFIKAG